MPLKMHLGLLHDLSKHAAMSGRRNNFYRLVGKKKLHIKMVRIRQIVNYACFKTKKLKLSWVVQN